MNVYEAAIRRRSIRRYQDKPVPYDVLKKCVDTARLAPSARNAQVCEYIIVDDGKLLPEVAVSITSWGGHPMNKENPRWLKQPKAYIVILVNSALEAKAGTSRIDTFCDSSMSAENIILTAQEEGLGSCVILGYKKNVLKQALNIPEGYDTALVIALGYPDDNPVAEVSTGSLDRWEDSEGNFHLPKRKLEDITHRNRFL